MKLPTEKCLSVLCFTSNENVSGYSKVITKKNISKNVSFQSFQCTVKQCSVSIINYQFLNAYSFPLLSEHYYFD